MKRRREPEFKAEADLCAAFIAQTGPEWTAYAETSGWDILLSRNSDGFQIGIEAKLQFNREVLLQAMDQHWFTMNEGPDCRAILVPWSASDALSAVCSYIGITVIRCRPKTEWSGPNFYPSLPSARFDRDWHELLPIQRIKLPEYVPDVPAGSSAPVQLTEWKIGALKLAVLLEHRGYLLREDFKRVHIDIRRWIAPGSRWLKPTERGFVADSHLPDFKGQHPTVFEQIKADPQKWMPAGELV